MIPPSERLASPDPYRPPGAALTVPAPSTGGAAVRLAGAFLILHALVSGGGTLWRVAHRPMPPVMLAGALAPTALALIVDALLSVPLLRGNLRFRVLTWVRALLSVVLPLFLAAVMTVGRRARGDQMVAWFHIQSAIAACPFAASIILLVHRGQRPWRLWAGLACASLYLVALEFPPLVMLGFLP